MNLYVVFINPQFYKSNKKLTQTECHFFYDFTEATEFAEENGGVEVYSRAYWNDDLDANVREISDIASGYSQTFVYKEGK